MRRLAFLFGAYLGLALLFTWPLALHLSDRVPGGNFIDQNQNLWNFWWSRFSLLNLRANPFHTDYLFYPYGSDLYLHTLNVTNGLLSLPFQLFGLVLAYNAVVLLALALTGLATYGLAASIYGPGVGAFLSGCLVVLAPNHLDYANGQLEFASLQWLIFYFWLLVRQSQQAVFKWRYVFGAAGLLTLIGYNSQYQILWAGLVGIIFLGWVAWRKTVPVRVFGLHWLADWLGFALLYSPVLIGAALQLSQNRVQPEERLAAIIGDSTDPLSLFVTRYQYSGLGRLLGNDRLPYVLEGHYFLGYGLLGLAISGLIFYFRQPAKARPALGLWLVVAVVFGILSLGPELRFNGQNTGLPLPYRLLLELPYGKTIRRPDRFSEMLLLGLGLVAGYGFGQIFGRLGRPSWKAIWVGLISLVIAFEFWSIPYPLNTVEIPAGYASLPGNGAVLDLPFLKRSIYSPRLMLFQTAHQRPIFQGYLSRDTETIYAGENSPLRPFRDFKAEPDIFEPPAAERLLDLLRIQRVGIIVLDRTALGKQADSAEEFLTIATGLPPYRREGLERSYYQVPDFPPRPALLLGEGWYGLEQLNQTLRGRWMGPAAYINIITPQATLGGLEFEAVAFAHPRRLQVILNGREVETLNITTLPGPFALKNLSLKPGLNQLQLLALDPPESPLALGLANDQRKLSVQVRKLKLGG